MDNNQLKVPCRKEKLKEVRVFVENLLKKQGIPDVEANKLVLAVDEVCANLMIHSHNCDPRKHIGIQINVIQGKEVIFEISDYGVGFNFCHYQEPSIEDIIKQKKKGGVGLMLVKRIMDNMEFIRKHNRNVYRLIKRVQVV